MVWPGVKVKRRENRVKYNDKYASREADMKNACLNGLAPRQGKKTEKTNSVKYHDKYGSREADMKNACLNGLAPRQGKKTGKLTALSIVTNVAQGKQI
jgi:hypothetical protein